MNTKTKVKPPVKVGRGGKKAPETVVVPAVVPISVNAERFRIAALACSTETSRYYLAGVYCEPHPKGGVNLVATNGHVLLHLHDPEGTCGKPAIIGLNKVMLQSCKPDKNDRYVKDGKRTLSFDPKTQTAQVSNAYGQAVAVQPSAEIDGTFPNYRAVVPKITPKKRVTSCFDGKLVALMCQVGRELGARTNGIAIHTDDLSGPSLVLWNGIDFAYGVVMPMKCAEAVTSGIMPEFHATNAV